MKSAAMIGGVLVAVMAMTSAVQTAGALTVPERRPAQVSVSLGGLDLSQASDAKVALLRLERAAATACFGGNRRLDRPATACRARALAEAVAAIGAPRLIVLHRAKSRAARLARG